MKQVESLSPQLDSVQSRALWIGLIAALSLVAGALLLAGPEQFFRSYLLGYLFWIGISFGSLGLLLLHQLVGGRWGFVMRRVLEAGALTLPLMALLFLPLLFGLGHLYEWTHPEEVAADEILQHKAAYLNVPFFGARALFYFMVATGLALLMRGWSRRLDESGDPTLVTRSRSLSGPGLILVSLIITFSAFDWVMSLEPHWFSTIYGMIFMAGNGLATLAFVVLALSLMAEHPPLSAVMSRDRFHDIGNLMLAFVMLWAYLSFSQFLIIWSGNLPEEIPWYLNRMAGGWQLVGLSLIVLHFALPFFLLLSRAVKKSVSTLCKVAFLVLALRFLDLVWLAVPAFHPGSFALHWLDLATPVAIGGLWVAVFVHHLKGAALLPQKDPRFEHLVSRQEAVEHG